MFVTAAADGPVAAAEAAAPDAPVVVARIAVAFKAGRPRVSAAFARRPRCVGGEKKSSIVRPFFLAWPSDMAFAFSGGIFGMSGDSEGRWFGARTQLPSLATTLLYERVISGHSRQSSVS